MNLPLSLCGALLAQEKAMWSREEYPSCNIFYKIYMQYTAWNLPKKGYKWEDYIHLKGKQPHRFHPSKTRWWSRNPDLATPRTGHHDSAPITLDQKYRPSHCSIQSVVEHSLLTGIWLRLGFSKWFPYRKGWFSCVTLSWEHLPIDSVWFTCLVSDQTYKACMEGLVDRMMSVSKLGVEEDHFS